MRGGGEEHRREDALPNALVEAGLELGVAHVLALEVFVQDVVVSLRGRLEELIAARLELRLQTRNEVEILMPVLRPGR